MRVYYLGLYMINETPAERTIADTVRVTVQFFRCADVSMIQTHHYYNVIYKTSMLYTNAKFSSELHVDFRTEGRNAESPQNHGNMLCSERPLLQSATASNK